MTQDEAAVATARQAGATAPRQGGPPHGGPDGRDGGPSLFSTLGLPDSQRLELWEDYNARSLIGLVCTTIGETPLAATELNLWLPSIQFSRVTSNPHMVERTSRQISAHPAAAVVLYVALAGEAFFYSQDDVRIVRPGEAVLHDADEPFARGFSRGLRELVLKIPYPVFERAVGELPRQTTRVLDVGRTAAADNHGRALAELMSATLRDGEAQDRPQVESDALALLGALVRGPAARGSATAQLRAAQAYVDRHLADHRLSAARIAAGIGISERQLSRVFSRDGNGVARWILDRRLELAHRALTSAGSTSIAAVADACGFSSSSYFSRVFRLRYAETPTEVRRRAEAEAAREAPGRVPR